MRTEQALVGVGGFRRLHREQVPYPLQLLVGPPGKDREFLTPWFGNLAGALQAEPSQLLAGNDPQSIKCCLAIIPI